MMNATTAKDQAPASTTSTDSASTTPAIDDNYCSYQQKEKDEQRQQQLAGSVVQPPRPQAAQQQKQQQFIILFYKYHPLSSDETETEIYRICLEKLCLKLKLKGRILVGCSEAEGINGTLAGEYWDVKYFTYALLGEEAVAASLAAAATTAATSNEGGEKIRMDALKEFWTESEAFFRRIQKPILFMKSQEDFKWSRCSMNNTTTTDNDEESAGSLFPDLNIKLVRELIGTGGVLSSISLEETAKGYLTPRQWHDELTKIKQQQQQEQQHGEGNDTVLIDCRNTKEVEIGHFSGAIDPQTTTFAQFPKWVDDHRHMLENKRILMYCTGGIRCEKASAYVRRQVPSVQNVHHLKGGIHKYLEEIEGDTTATTTNKSHFVGTNFVFHNHVETKLGGCDDGDGGANNDNESPPPQSATTTTKDNNNNNTCATNQDHTIIVGRCCYCQKPYDRFDPRCVCTVCREPLLACVSCQGTIYEFHCKKHFHLRSCYFTNLSPFSADELNEQLKEIETILIKFAVGKRFKQKRKTLNKQIDKIRQRLVTIIDLGGEDDGSKSSNANVKGSLCLQQQRCRNCDDDNCSGKCWGFLGLKRKEVLEEKQRAKKATKDNIAGVVPIAPTSNGKDKKRSMKEMNRERVRKEFELLELCQMASANRDSATGIRVPPPCTRVLQTKMKGKWKGVPVLQVVKEEFIELAKPGVLVRVLEGGLLQVNGTPVTNENAGVGLQTGDTISRISHWHEPPVIVPEELSIQKIPLPDSVKSEFDISSDDKDPVLYVCNKPSSVPVHPAGPYLSNSLTMMVEAQERLPPQSLYPCHRTDRVTSGLTICCTNSKVATVVQRSMCEKQVQKLYIARVQGKFYASKSELAAASIAINSEIVKASFLDTSQCVHIDAPIETIDPANGVRKITEKGKPASSLFRLLSYDSVSNLSVLCCRPITGRSHQLRVHLQHLGHPIVGDVLYGGPSFGQGGNHVREGAAVQALLKSTTGNIQERRGLNISVADATAARKACAMCNPQNIEGGGDAISVARNYYTSAQLLESGHAINLHASRYRIEVLPKKKKDDSTAEILKAFAILDLKVDSPDWAGVCQNESLPWLEENLAP